MKEILYPPVLTLGQDGKPEKPKGGKPKGDKPKEQDGQPPAEKPDEDQTAENPGDKGKEEDKDKENGGDNDESPADKAQDQLEGVEKAQQDYKKGRRKRPIDSIKKSEQRAKHAWRRKYGF